MMRIIDADTLIAHIKKRLKNEMIIAWLCRIIDEVPTIEAEPVRHGRWIWKDFHGDGSIILCCSECLETEGARKNADYCPNCGCKMQGVE